MTPHTYDAFARTAGRAAVAAGTFLVKYAGKPGSVYTKRSAIDLVTEIDRASERMIHRALQRAYPDFGFLGEESGQQPHHSPYRWIVDPIDGTNNFVHGFPMFGVSIGLEHLGRLIVGVIYDPTRRELFIATAGGGATLNGTRIRVSPTRQLAKSLLSTGFSSHFLKRRQPYLRWFESFQRSSHGVRRLGSTVISLAAIAAGRLEGFYERDLWPWDIAAGMLLVTEAGGRISGLHGEPATLTSGRLVASNGRIHRQMLRVLNAAR